MKDNSKCIILTPTLDRPERATEDKLRELHKKGYQVHILYGCSWIDLARSRLASMAIREGFEEIFWIDHDITFDVESFEKLRSHNLPVACGVYPQRQIGPDIMIVMSPGDHFLTFGDNGSLVEVMFAPSGFFYVQRQVYEDIKKTFNLPDCVDGSTTFTPYYLPMVIQNSNKTYSYLGEDGAFCERVRQSGYKIYLDTTIRLGHIGKYEYSWEEIKNKKQTVNSITFHIHQDF